MAESSNGSGALIFAAGTLFGAFLVYLILKGREQPAQAAAAQQPHTLMMPSFMPQYVDMNSELQRMSAELGRLRQDNAELRAQIQIAAPKGPVVTASKPEPPQIPAPAPQITAPKTVTVQNEEEWVVKKDKRGRLEGITVHRTVKHA